MIYITIARGAMKELTTYVNPAIAVGRVVNIGMDSDGRHGQHTSKKLQLVAIPQNMSIRISCEDTDLGGRKLRSLKP